MCKMLLHKHGGVDYLRVSKLLDEKNYRLFLLGALTIEVVAQMISPIWRDAQGKIMFRSSSEFKECKTCYGYGLWLGEWIPIVEHETTYADSDECPECGAYNWKKDCADDSCSPPWDEEQGDVNKFRAAIKKFRRKVCAASSAIRAIKRPLDF